MATKISEGIFSNVLRNETGALPLIASLRVALLLGARIGETDVIDEAAVNKAREIVSETLEFWSNKSSEVCLWIT